MEMLIYYLGAPVSVYTVNPSKSSSHSTIPINLLKCFLMGDSTVFTWIRHRKFLNTTNQNYSLKKYIFVLVALISHSLNYCLLPFFLNIL